MLESGGFYVTLEPGLAAKKWVHYNILSHRTDIFA